VNKSQKIVAVIGPGDGATPKNIADAYCVGSLLANAGVTIINGGGNGVMAAVSQGASENGGISIGLLPGLDSAKANPYLTIAIPTGLGEIRNALIVRAADAVICIGGSWGTLSEIGFSVRTEVPLIILNGWDLPDGAYTLVASAEQAVTQALRHCSGQ